MIWKNGKPINLGTLGGMQGVADAVNDFGLAVGVSLTCENKTREYHALSSPMTHLEATSLETDSHSIGSMKAACFGGKESRRFLEVSVIQLQLARLATMSSLPSLRASSS